MIPEDWNGIPLRSLLALNPMTDFVEIARGLLYELRLPPLGPVLYCVAWTVAMAALAVLRLPQVGPRRQRGDMTENAIEAVGLSKKFLHGRGATHVAQGAAGPGQGPGAQDVLGAQGRDLLGAQGIVAGDHRAQRVGQVDRAEGAHRHLPTDVRAR